VSWYNGPSDGQPDMADCEEKVWPFWRRTVALDVSGSGQEVRGMSQRTFRPTSGVGCAAQSHGSKYTFGADADPLKQVHYCRTPDELDRVTPGIEIVSGMRT